MDPTPGGGVQLLTIDYTPVFTTIYKLVFLIPRNVKYSCIPSVDITWVLSDLLAVILIFVGNWMQTIAFGQ